MNQAKNVPIPSGKNVPIPSGKNSNLSLLNV